MSQSKQPPKLVARLLMIFSVAMCLITPTMHAADPQPIYVGDRAAIISIDGEIDDVLLTSLEDRVEKAKDAGATTLIFKINTWGGYVTSAIDINALFRNQPSDIRTIAWVNTRAISAGAMIAVGCDQIYMTSSSRIGDCAPIRMDTSNMGETERAKAESPVLQVFRDSSAQNGYSRRLCEAMVRLDVEVWWIERIDTLDDDQPERKFVTTDELDKYGIEIEKDSEDGKFKRWLPKIGQQAEWQLVESVPNPVGGEPLEIRRPVDGKTELLTLSQSEAVVYGLAAGIVNNRPELEKQLNTSVIQEYDMSNWHAFVSWLNNPAVRGIFFILMLLGGYIEFQSPGLILPGSVALVAGIIFFVAPHAAGVPILLPLLIMLVGIVFLAIEIFVTPGFGVFGVLGIVLILAGLVGSFIPATDPDAPWWHLPSFNYGGAWTAMKTGLLVVLVGIILSSIGLMALSVVLPQLPGMRRLIPANPEGVNLPLYDAHPDTALVGDVGLVVGDLKPAGLARFGNEVVDVTTQGEFVDAGMKVQVIRREGMNIFVRPLKENTEA